MYQYQQMTPQTITDRGNWSSSKPSFFIDKSINYYYYYDNGKKKFDQKREVWTPRPLCTLAGQQLHKGSVWALEVPKCEKRWRLNSLTHASGRYRANESPWWRDFIIDEDDVFSPRVSRDES